MNVDELPEQIRVKLPEKQERKLWEEIEAESIAEFAQVTSYSTQQLYNWKNKDVFLPVDLVRQVLKDFEVSSMKGRNNSRPIENPEFPLKITDELVTRVYSSVSVNGEGTPFYRVKEASLLKRFYDLLENIGDVPISTYRRSGYQLRYPKYLHELIVSQEHSTDFAALFDEKGEFKEGEYMVVDEVKLNVTEFEGNLWSDRKKYKLALLRNDSEELKHIIESQSQKMDNLEDVT